MTNPSKTSIFKKSTSENDLRDADKNYSLYKIISKVRSARKFIFASQQSPSAQRLNSNLSRHRTVFRRPALNVALTWWWCCIYKLITGKKEDSMLYCTLFIYIYYHK